MSDQIERNCYLRALSASSMDHGGVGQVGCERDDGTLMIHANTEFCDVCRPRRQKESRVSDVKRYRLPDSTKPVIEECLPSGHWSPVAWVPAADYDALAAEFAEYRQVDQMDHKTRESCIAQLEAENAELRRRCLEDGE